MCVQSVFVHVAARRELSVALAGPDSRPAERDHVRRGTRRSALRARELRLRTRRTQPSHYHSHVLLILFYSWISYFQVFINLHAQFLCVH